MRQISRRKFLGLGGALVAVLSLARPAQAIEVADLKERLEKDLRARRPSEFAFVDRVVELVNQGDLPLALVNTTYLWARPKKPYPFPYFERALRIRTQRLGIDL